MNFLKRNKELWIGLLVALISAILVFGSFIISLVEGGVQ